MTRLQRAFTAICLAAVSVLSCSQDRPSSIVVQGPEIDGEATTGASGFSEQDNAAIGLLPPSQLATSRAVDPDALTLTIDVTQDGETQSVSSERDPSTGRFVGTVFIPTGTTVDISIMWSETFRSTTLPLAQATRIVPIPFNIDELEISFPSNIYNTTFDTDRDGLANLAERNSNTDPLSALDPGDPVVLVNVDVRLQTPIQLQDSVSNPAAPSTMVNAELNETPVSLTFDGTNWVGTTTAVQGSDAFLTADDYQTDFDDDNDGFFNFVEFSENTDALDFNDPPRDPCELTQFGEGCDVDSDSDNIPDSVEGANADSDEDGTPNYLESVLVDDDGDGLSRQDDRDETNACIPSDTNEACLASLDEDSDGIQDNLDNCPFDANPDQADADNDGVGDACEGDADGDGILDDLDNCPADSNANQNDFDNDGQGDVCDDSDNDTVFDNFDNCPVNANTDQADADNDGIGNECEADTDSDGIPDDVDNCPVVANTPQSDFNILDDIDNCPVDANTDQSDTDNDGTGDACESDGDFDSIPDDLDNCPAAVNPDQDDFNNDGQGDALPTPIRLIRITTAQAMRVKQTPIAMASPMMWTTAQRLPIQIKMISIMTGKVTPVTTLTMTPS